MEKRTTHYAESNKEHSNLDDNNDSFETISVAPIPNKGIGIAINDRLERASKK